MFTTPQLQPMTLSIQEHLNSPTDRAEMLAQFANIAPISAEVDSALYGTPIAPQVPSNTISPLGSAPTSPAQLSFFRQFSNTGFIPTMAPPAPQIISSSSNNNINAGFFHPLGGPLMSPPLMSPVSPGALSDGFGFGSAEQAHMHGMHPQIPSGPIPTRSSIASPSAKRHICKICSKPFTRPSSLQTHMYTHTGEKPFPCDVKGCERRFSVVSNLRRHRKVHKQQDAAKAGKADVPASPLCRTGSGSSETPSSPTPSTPDPSSPPSPAPEQRQCEQRLHQQQQQQQLQQNLAAMHLLGQAPGGAGSMHDFQDRLQTGLPELMSMDGAGNIQMEGIQLDMSGLTTFGMPMDEQDYKLFQSM